MVVGAVILVGLAVSPNLATASLLAATMGVAAGATWVSGYTLLHERVPDRIRGRTFGSLTLLVRIVLFLSLSAFPLLSEAFGRLAPDETGAGLGARAALAVGAGVVFTGGVLARKTLAGTTEQPHEGETASRRRRRAEE